MRIYLDCAATSLEKPQAVPQAAAWAMTHLASPGRGGYAASDEAARVMFQCRSEAAQLLGVSSPENVILTSNATHGLNIAIHSLARPGARVICSGYEHNAVTRPLHAVPGIRLTVVRSPLFDPDAAAEAFAQALEQPADLAVCTMVSNVFGFILPIDRIAQLCQMRGVPLIVDASQGAGMLPVNVDAWKAAFVALPGHKGLYGPQGTGLLLCGSSCTGAIPQPLLRGGTGSVSRLQGMPEFLPDRLEAGTQNVCGAAGLLEGIRFVRRKTPEALLRYEKALAARMMDRLASVPGITLYRGRSGSTMAGLFSFTAEGRDVEELGAELARRGIAVRAGLHCAPLAHETAGTLDTGTVRVSFSAFNTAAQADAAAAAIREILRR